MSNLTSGWNLTARLVAKHFSALGDHVAETIASFDPETATQADRDALQQKLQETAIKLAGARKAYQKEHDDVVALQALVATDSQVATVLGDRLQKGEITEAQVTAFLDELEANKGRIPQEKAEEADAKNMMDELQKLVDLFSKQLEKFDAAAKKAKAMLSSAEAQKTLQIARKQQQDELGSLAASANGTSSALAALTKRAERVSTEAEGLKIVTDLAQAPLDHQADINALRKSVAAGAAPAETTMERLRRLSAMAEAPAA